MNSPFIGVTSGEVTNLHNPKAPATQGNRFTYINSIADAGGLPVLIPILDNADQARELYEKLDGILFTGGNDIDPELYGEEPHEKLSPIHRKRDDYELQLLTWALEDNKPILGICRGMQLINVRQGGTLHQDIASLVPESLEHDESDTIVHFEDSNTDHTVLVEQDSHLAAILQTDSIAANTFHHQAINSLGDGLRINAHAKDGIIEGIELPSAEFVVGVQCHPESLQRNTEPGWRKLFSAFVRAAEENRVKAKSNPRILENA